MTRFNLEDCIFRVSASSTETVDAESHKIQKRSTGRDRSARSPSRLRPKEHDDRSFVLCFPNSEVSLLRYSISFSSVDRPLFLF